MTRKVGENAHSPAVRYVVDSASLRRGGVPELDVRYALQRWSAGYLAVPPLPGFEYFSDRAHLDAQWAVELARLYPGQVLGRADQGGGGGADSAGALGGADGVR